MNAYIATTTLNAIRAQRPCRDGWEKLLASLGKTQPDDDPLHLLTILNSNGLDDTLWVLQNTGCDERLSRHFGAWCSEQVLHIFEANRPNDNRPRLAIECARNDDATPAQRDAARAAAGVAARDAAGVAARDAARAAAWDAAWGAARAAARAAAWDAAGAAAWDAAGAAARDAAGDKQTAQLRKMLEAAK